MPSSRELEVYQQADPGIQIMIHHKNRSKVQPQWCIVQGPTHHFCNSSMNFHFDGIILKAVMWKDAYREPCIPWVTFRKDAGKTPNQVFRVWIEFCPVGVQCYGQKTSTVLTCLKKTSATSFYSLFSIEQKNQSSKIGPWYQDAIIWL